jgi:hypothetical protein
MMAWSVLSGSAPLLLASRSHSPHPLGGDNVDVLVSRGVGVCSAVCIIHLPHLLIGVAIVAKEPHGVDGGDTCIWCSGHPN